MPTTGHSSGLSFRTERTDIPSLSEVRTHHPLHLLRFESFDFGAEGFAPFCTVPRDLVSDSPAALESLEWILRLLGAAFSFSQLEQTFAHNHWHPDQFRTVSCSCSDGFLLRHC